MKEVIGYKTKIVVTNEDGKLVKRTTYIPIYKDLGPRKLTTIDTDHFPLKVDKLQSEIKDIYD